MEFIITVVVRAIVNTLLAFFFIGVVAVGFLLFHMSLHTDLFTASAIVTFVLAPRVEDDD